MEERDFEEVERLEEYEALMQQVEDGAYDGDGPANVAEVELEVGDTNGE